MFFQSYQCFKRTVSHETRFNSLLSHSKRCLLYRLIERCLHFRELVKGSLKYHFFYISSNKKDKFERYSARNTHFLDLGNIMFHLCFYTFFRTSVSLHLQTSVGMFFVLFFSLINCNLILKRRLPNL